MIYSLTEYRESRNISMKDWAKIMGVSIETAADWESGNKYPTTRQLHKICEITDMGASSLLDKGEYDEYIHNRRSAYISIIFAEIIWLILSTLMVYSFIQPVKTLDVALFSWIIFMPLTAVVGIFVIICIISGILSKWYKATRITVALITVILLIVTFLTTAFL